MSIFILLYLSYIQPPPAFSLSISLFLSLSNYIFAVHIEHLILFSVPKKSITPQAITQRKHFPKRHILQFLKLANLSLHNFETTP